MLTIASLQHLLGADPVLTTTLLAAGFLALIALGAGAVRRDFAVLRHPIVVLEVAAAVALAVLLAFGNAALHVAVLGDPTATWWLDGVRRLPLYLIALAYGPSVGLVAALLFGAFEAGVAGRSVLFDARVAILALELTVIGWLAIYPSPRQSRWSGPLHALVGYGLAWGTAGLALLRFEAGAVTLPGLAGQHAGTIGGMALGALLLATVPPAAYRALFPRSRIAPAGERRPPRRTLVAGPGTQIDPRSDPRIDPQIDPRIDPRIDPGAELPTPPVARRARRSPSTTLTQVDLPGLELPSPDARGAERRRHLDPPPDPE